MVFPPSMLTFVPAKSIDADSRTMETPRLISIIGAQPLRDSAIGTSPVMVALGAANRITGRHNRAHFFNACP